MTASVTETDAGHDQTDGSERHRRRIGLGTAAITCGIAFLVGAMAALVVNALLSGPSLEIVEGTFQAATGDLDGISIDGGEGEYDISHATGVECLSEASPGDPVFLGIANIDSDDVDIPFQGEIHGDRVVLWVTCATDGVRL